MCGIAGIISKEPITGDENILSMLDVIKHRGPDSRGFWTGGNVSFGMQRLSIIDLEGGQQPIWSENGVGIVFNGEIYNFKKLRTELEKEGVTFHTHSDTEVILHLYLRDGIACIKRLEGMFAICLYDPRSRMVYLVRDRLGVKPLYYTSSNGQICFGSEIKSLLQIIPSPKLNLQSLAYYLNLRFVPHPETIWEGIVKLPPAHVMEVDLETLEKKITCYWKCQFQSQPFDSSRNYDKEFERLFLEAVEKRLLAADVPVGILLSGGLDSSCVAAAALELGHKNFHTFSIGFKDGGAYSELGYAKQAAQYIGSVHHEISIGEEEFMSFLSDSTWFSDEPIADLASIPLYYVSKLAREHVKVVLSGEGSDEILAGYNLDEHSKILHKLKLLSNIPRSLLKFAPNKTVRYLGEVGYSNFLSSKGTHITDVFSDEEIAKLLGRDLKKAKDLVRSWYKLTNSREPLDQLQQAYCMGWLVEDLLMKADKMSMATSLELRVPFLDHKLVEWAATLPLEMKVGSASQGFSTKLILRRFAEKRIPSEIIKRPKQGFPVPAYNWIRKDLKAFAKEKIERSPLIDEFIKKPELASVWAQLDANSLEAAHKIWSLLILASWGERYHL